ncbi:MAG: Hsp33 family molecular chaperone HslO [Acidobacteriota bacterium]
MNDAVASDGLPASRLYTFIDPRREFALYFLEGQRLIADLAIRHRTHGRGFNFFRDVVLSIQPMIALLKHGEQLGFYIDSENPEFFVKIETGHHGATRCSLWPDRVIGFPGKLDGTVRVQKVSPAGGTPYESVLSARNLPLPAIVNQVLAESYQVNSTVVVSQASDQSAMLHQLPPLPRQHEYVYSIEAVRARQAEIQEQMDLIFARALQAPDEIETAFDAIGFRLLAGREVAFLCACSRERMVANIKALVRQQPGDLFDPGQDMLEVTCEYCKKEYRIGREDVGADAPTVH